MANLTRRNFFKVLAGVLVAGVAGAVAKAIPELPDISAADAEPDERQEDLSTGFISGLDGTRWESSLTMDEDGVLHVGGDYLDITTEEYSAAWTDYVNGLSAGEELTFDLIYE